MRDERDEQRRIFSAGWLRVTPTAFGLLATALATAYVIKTGNGAVTDEPESSPRHVVATVAPSHPRAAALERAVRVNGPAAQARPQLDLRQIVYTVAGNQRPDDPVTIVYADETGTLQTAANVTLPWTLTLIPSLPVNYLTASSRGSQLNCWITDAAGSTVAAQTDFSTSATCNR